MKKITNILLLILISWSSKETTSNKKVITTAESIEIPKQDTVAIDSLSKTNKITGLRHYEYYFVSAKSGVEYKDKPNGKVLGKFPLNTHLKVVEHTSQPGQVNDGIKIINGEWLGVEKEKDTVYVLNAFLSDFVTYSDIELYNISPFYKEREGTRTAFVNLSETFFQNTYTDIRDTDRKLILFKENLSKDTIKLNINQRKKFLESIEVSESDKVYIYEFEKDSVYTFDVQNLPLIACINIYFNGNDYEKSEYDFEFGLDLGKNYNGSYENFVYIGKENPFQTNKFKPIKWKKTDNENFPIEKDETGIELETFTFSLDTFRYFAQKPKEKGASYHIVVKDEKHNTIVFDKHYYESEGISLTQLNSTYQSQYTGALFKNKPPIIYGFTNHSFDCPNIKFIDETEPPIPVLCDNRH